MYKKNKKNSRKIADAFVSVAVEGLKAVQMMHLNEAIADLRDQRHEDKYCRGSK